jgi:hypothetical protein
MVERKGNLCLLALFAFFLAWASQGEAQTRRAVLVGINKYHPAVEAASPGTEPNGEVKEAVAKRRDTPKSRGSYPDLDGCLNDVDAMHDVLIARYGFLPENVTVLRDSEATREGIFAAIRKNLIESVSSGDEVVFFYAGHGSQVTNSKSSEPDKKDETIVPADAFYGTPDIRDKELRKILNEVLDRGALLTAIFDCCHSGSIARGLPAMEKIRFLEPDPRDVADPTSPEPPPEERGAIILSSTQDADPAAEAPADEQNPAHGAFSLAFLKVLKSAPVTLPVDQIFSRTKALMQSSGRKQEPVLAGPGDRRQVPLFGKPGAALTGRAIVPVLRVADNGEVLLQAGVAIGLSEACELKKAGVSTAAQQIRLKVKEVMGMSKSRALVIEGKAAAIHAGDLFEVDRWVGGKGTSLQVWVPPNAPSLSKLRAFASGVKAALSARNVRMVEDPTVETPTHVLEWSGSSWNLIAEGKVVEDLGKSPAARIVAEKITSTEGTPRFFLNIPLPAELMSTLSKGIGGATSPVQFARSRREAHYFLAGRQVNGELSLAWVLPNASREDSAVMALPIRSSWIPVTGPGGDGMKGLGELALRAAKIRAWMALESPPDEGAFPYRLALKNSRTGELKRGGVIVEKEPYGLVLTADANLDRPAETRYVYVFCITSYGESILLFPRSGSGNAENRLPYVTAGETKIPTEIQLGRKTVFLVGEPFGTDTYILLTTEQAIPDPDALAFEGIRTSIPERAAVETPLSSLLMGIGTNLRSPQMPTPADWSIERLSITSIRASQEHSH